MSIDCVNLRYPSPACRPLWLLPPWYCFTPSTIRNEGRKNGRSAPFDIQPAVIFHLLLFGCVSYKFLAPYGQRTKRWISSCKTFGIVQKRLKGSHRNVVLSSCILSTRSLWAMKNKFYTNNNPTSDDFQTRKADRYPKMNKRLRLVNLYVQSTSHQIHYGWQRIVNYRVH